MANTPLPPQQISPHLQKLKEWADGFQAEFAREDKFPPKLTPDDGTLVASLHSRYISYYFTTKVFTKREPHPDELGLDIYGDPCVAPYIADRLRNEGAVLRYLAEHTTIPVSRCLDVWTENGLVHLKTALVDTGSELRHLDESRLQAAVEHVSAQLESDILPQLRALRRKTMGSPDTSLPVIPPRRVWDWKGKRVFPSTIAGIDEYVLGHTDLDRQNILVDPDTFRIVCILDWETAGFFPAEWELPLWKGNTREERHRMWEAVKERDLAMLGFGPKVSKEVGSAA